MEEEYIYKVDYSTYKIEHMRIPKFERPLLAHGSWYTDKPFGEIENSLREILDKDYAGEYVLNIGKVKRIEGHL